MNEIVNNNYIESVTTGNTLSTEEMEAALVRMDKTNKELECKVAKLRVMFNSFSKNEAAYKTLFKEDCVE